MGNDLEQLGERIAEQAAHLDAAMHRLLADLRVFDARGGWRAQGAASCAQWLAWRVGWDLVTARDHVRVARKLAEFPAIDEALRCGEVSYSKVRAMLFSGGLRQIHFAAASRSTPAARSSHERRRDTDPLGGRGPRSGPATQADSAVASRAGRRDEVAHLRFELPRWSSERGSRRSWSLSCRSEPGVKAALGGQQG